MSKIEYDTSYFKVTYTVEETPPHPTIPYDYYYDTYSITVMFKGRGSCSVEGNVYEISDGDMMLLSPDEIRSFQFENEGYHERLSIYFSDSVLVPFLEYELPLMKLFHRRALGLGNKYSFDSYAAERAWALIGELKTAVVRENEPINTARLHVLILQLLFWIYDARKLGESYEAPTLGDPTTFKICKYIKSHLEGDLSYATLQRELLVSRYQLTSVFSRNMGMTLTEYIIRKRLSKVVSLVLGGDGIELAAYRSGFHTYSNFYENFTKYYQTSPQSFFKSNAKDEKKRKP